MGRGYVEVPVMYLKLYWVLNHKVSLAKRHLYHGKKQEMKS